MMKFPFMQIPLWEVLVSLSILAVSTVIVTWAAARVFRWALLLYGKKPNMFTILRVITNKQEIGVRPTASAEMEKSA